MKGTGSTWIAVSMTSMARVRIAVGFLDERTMVVKIVDRGFGELFPKTDAEIRQEVRV